MFILFLFLFSFLFLFLLLFLFFFFLLFAAALKSSKKDACSNKETVLTPNESLDNSAALLELNYHHDQHDQHGQCRSSINGRDDSPPSPALLTAVDVKVMHRQSSQLNWNIVNSYSSPEDTKRYRTITNNNANSDNHNATSSSRRNIESDGKKYSEKDNNDGSNNNKNNNDDDIKLKRTTSFLHLISGGGKGKAAITALSSLSPKSSSSGKSGTGTGFLNGMGIFKRKNRSFGVADSSKSIIAAAVADSVQGNGRDRGGGGGGEGRNEVEKGSEWNRPPKPRSGSYSVESSATDSLRGVAGSGGGISAQKFSHSSEKGRDTVSTESKSVRPLSKPEGLRSVSTNTNHPTGLPSSNMDKGLPLYNIHSNLPQSPTSSIPPPTNTNPKHLDLLVTPKGWKLGDKLILNARSFTLNSALHTSSTESSLASLISTPHLLIAALLEKAFYLSNAINGEPPTKSAASHTKCPSSSSQHPMRERLGTPGSEEITPVQVQSPVPTTTSFRGLENSSVLLRSPKTVVDDFLYGVANGRQREKDRDRDSEKDRDRERELERERGRERGREGGNSVVATGTSMENSNSNYHNNISVRTSYQEENEEGEHTIANNHDSDSDDNNNHISNSNNSSNNNNNNNEDIHNDYMSDEVQVLWIELMDGVALLQSCSAHNINPQSDQTLCMFLNLYHLMVIHSSLVMGPPCSAYKVP